MRVRLVLYLLFFVLAAFLIIRHVESRSIFFPMKGVPEAVGYAGAHEDVFFAAEDGTKLHGWFFPSASAAAPTILFLHGNAGHIGHRLEKIQTLHDLDVPVFIFDYRGYGQSEGRPSESGIYKDVDAAYATLIKRGIAPERILLYGESIGGAFAIDLASRKTVGALIAEEAFTSVPAMVHRTMPLVPGFMLATRLDSLSKIKKVRAPKLIFHSVDDEIVPFTMGQALFDASPEPKRFVKLRGGHNTTFLDDAGTYRNGLAGFISGLKN